MTESRIEKLMDLAKERSSSARSALMENITDLFLTEDGRLTDHERALMSDILAKLLSQVESNVRRELSSALMRSGIDMPEVIQLLAHDEIEVARPLLEKSDLLKDPELIEIVRMRTEEHRIAIAQRDDLSEDVTNAIVEYGEEDAIEALLTNHDTNLSARAMEYLVAESRRVDRFQEPLLQRSDLPGDLAYKMFWWVSAALRKKIIEDHEVDPVALEAAVTKAARAALVDQDKEDSAYVRAQKLVRRMAENGELTHQFLAQSLRQRRVAVFVAGLAELGGVSFKTAWRIFSDKGGESFAILARAVDMDRSLFTTNYLLMSEYRGGKSVASPKVLNKILALYDKASPARARGALMVWQRDSAYQAAIEELEAVA